MSARPTQPQGAGAPRSIIWLADGKAYVATDPVESTMCRIVAGVAEQHPSVMTRRAVRRATEDEVMEWRIRP